MKIRQIDKCQVNRHFYNKGHVCHKLGLPLFTNRSTMRRNCILGLFAAALWMCALPANAWYDTAWLYRRAVNVDNTGGASALTNLQVLVIDTNAVAEISAGKMEADGADIRVVDSDDATPLDYFLESPGRVWVKIPNIPALTSKTVYLYYGNPSAAAVTSATNTFIRVVDGLVASWHFEEGSGTSAYDSSGFDNTITLYNGPTWVPEGRHGGGLSLDGIDDSLRAVDNSVLQMKPDGTPYTLFMWIKPNTATGESAFVFNKESAYRFSVANDDIYVRHFTNNTASVNISKYNVLSAGTWSSVAAQYDGENIRLCADTSYGSWTSAGPTIGDSSGKVVSIASKWAKWFYGECDEAAIYTNCLSDAELLDLYNNRGYSTTNQPGRMFVRQNAAPEPTITVMAAESAIRGIIIIVQ